MQLLQRFIAAFAATVTSFIVLSASEHEATEVIRPVNSSYMLEAGSSHLADTYLSGLKYVGWNMAFQYERTQAMKFSPDLWRQQLLIGVEGSGADNPARNSTLYYANLSASWGMYRRWELPHGLAAGVGGSAGGNIGVVYSNRNSNNPASVKADITVNAGGFVAWRTRLWRMPVLLRWQTSMPLTGVFFSPEYDELYYEIYLGNHSGLAHWGWPGNLFRWDNLVTADLDFSNTRLRLGFRSRIYSTQENNLTTRIFSYAFVLGVTGDWMSLSPRRGMPDQNASRVVYAY